MDVLIVIGDQDSYHEGEHDVVSSPIWLADILSDEGVTGLFVIQARRATILAEQGRTEVIAAIRHHEIGLHGRDIHPTYPEVVEGLSWGDGIEALMETEHREVDQIGQVFDVAPVCLSEHRNQTAPQIFRVARNLGLPYLFGNPAAPPRHSISWYAGALNVPFNAPVPDFLGFFPAVFDDVLHDDADFARRFEQLRQHVSRSLAVQLPLLVVFACHPERLCYSGAIEQWMYGNGVNHGRAAVPPGVEVRHDRTEIERALRNFRTLVRYLRDTPGLEPITVRNVIRRYSQQAEQISRSTLIDVASRATNEHEIVIGGEVSAGEATLGFADSLRHLTGEGTIPDTVTRHDVLGPTEAPPLAPEVTSLSPEQLAAVATEIVSHSRDTGHLPAATDVDGRRVGLGSLYGALAEAYLTASRGLSTPVGGIPVTIWPRYPAGAVALGDRARLAEEDPLVRPGITTDRLALLTRLQTWTLKAAPRH